MTFCSITFCDFFVALGQAQISHHGISDPLQFIPNHLCTSCSLSSPTCGPTGLLSVSTCVVASHLCMSVKCPLPAFHCGMGDSTNTSYVTAVVSAWLSVTLYHNRPSSSIMWGFVILGYIRLNTFWSGIISYPNFRVQGPAPLITSFFS